MAISGFKCPQKDGIDVDFSTCQHRCLYPCHPLPLLAAQLQTRVVVPGVYSMTEVLKPYRIIHWTRHNDYFIEPTAHLVMVSGSAAHHVIEEGGKLLDDQENHKFEVYGEAQVAGVKLRGTYDYGDISRRQLWDYKNLGSYRVDDLKEFEQRKGAWYEDEYSAQMNGYRAFFWPEASELLLEVLVQGWTRRSGLEHVERFSLPVAPVDEAKVWFENRIKNILAHEAGAEIPDCSDSERWWNPKTKKYNRCAGFCPVLPNCKQGMGI
jgi:hypothetical protein